MFLLGYLFPCPISVVHADHPLSLALGELGVAAHGQLALCDLKLSFQSHTTRQWSSPYSCGCCQDQRCWGSCPAKTGIQKSLPSGSVCRRRNHQHQSKIGLGRRGRDRTLELVSILLGKKNISIPGTHSAQLHESLSHPGCS